MKTMFRAITPALAIASIGRAALTSPSVPRRCVIALVVASLLAVLPASPRPAFGAAPSSPVVAARAIVTPPASPTLLSTGQTTPYTGNSGSIGPGNQDDGDLIRGRAQRFATAGNNLVIDDNTGLMWLADPVLAVPGTHPWATALTVVEDLDYGGFSDWRLPNLKELQTLVDYSKVEPSLDATVFPRPYDDYPSAYGWTSTTSPANPTDAFYVNFLNGHTYPFGKATSLGIFPVRTALPVNGGAGGGAAGDDAANLIALLTTGQTVSFGTGDDGALQTGTQPTYSVGGGQITTQATNITTDQTTGLMWIRDPFLVTGDGPSGTGVAGDVDLATATDWQAAIDAASELDYGGFSDWRLPNLVELESLSRSGAQGGLHDPTVFTNAPVDSTNPDRYVWWSSTTSAYDRSPAEPGSQAAWYVTTALGSTNFGSANFAPAKTRGGFIRPVRDIAASPSPAQGLAEIRATAEFDALTIASPRADTLREGKFVVPTVTQAPDAPFASAFQNVSTYQLHLDFLLNEYPDDFAGLSEDQYLGITGTRASRQYWAGGLRSFLTASGTTAYGFDVAYDRSEPTELPTEAEITEVFQALSSSFRRRPLVYSPRDDAAIAAASSFVNPEFEIDYPAPAPDPDYEAYTTGRAYGTVRTFTLPALLIAAREGELSSQDIVVVDGAPSDLAAIVAAIVTEDRQSALAHLPIRTARRGTPNVYVTDATTALAEYDGQLVRLDAGADGLSITTDVTIEQAQAWWDSIRPDPIQPAPADDVSAALDEIATIGADDQAIGRIGGKAANLAALYTVLAPQYQVDAFAIPFSAYVDFISSNTLLDERTTPPTTRTYAEYIDSLHADNAFMTDPRVRARMLEELIDEMRDNGQIDPAALAAVSERVDEVFGVGTKVRFRSSSNAEDALEFSGAGLYDSTSACTLDATDGDSLGPSLCDPGQSKERTVERAMKKVWASLWNPGAWEEREYFGMRHVDTRMGILVSTAFPDERANGVAFTGDPSGLTDGYLINVQDGDTSVVFPESGVTPETDRLLVANGSVESIIRVRPSSLVDQGAQVMSDAELTELGEVMAQVDAALPVDVGEFERDDILLDFEFKIQREDDSLVFKQVRPFLKPSAAANTQAELRVEVPAAITLCSSWTEGLEWRDELDRRLLLELAPGEAVVPYAEEAPGAGPRNHSLFGFLQTRSPISVAPPLGSGVVEVEVEDELVDVSLSRSYTTGERRIDVRLGFTDLAADQFSAVRLDSATLQAATRITAATTDVASGSLIGTTRLVPCSLDQLTEATFDVELADGTEAIFVQRRERFDGVSGLADLVSATVQSPAGAAIVSNPAALEYRADRHHWNEQFVVLFPSPIDGHVGLVFAIDSGASGITGYRASWLSSGGSGIPVEISTVNGMPVGGGPSGVSTLGPEAMVTVSCLGGNGRVDTNIVNVGPTLGGLVADDAADGSATYRVEFGDLSQRARTLALGDWWRLPVTGRPDGNYDLTVMRDDTIVSTQVVTIACDQPVPLTPDDSPEVVNSCRAGNGYLLFQFTNPSALPVAYVVIFDNVPNRSTTVPAFGQSVRAVTGRPDGTWNYAIRKGGTIVDEGSVIIDCDAP